MGGMITAASGVLPRAWSLTDFLLTLAMWAVMMAAMMIPSAAPMVLLFDMVQRKQAAQSGRGVPTSIFVLGYLVAWTGFSLAAAIGQEALAAAALLSPMMASASPILGGALLIIAGLYQWTPLKDACLAHCQSPLSFITGHWRNGRGGAFRMGLHHGTYCVGCCWALMALLFVVGVMNLLWIGLLTAFVIAEKLVARGPWFSRATGVGLLVWGAWLLQQGLTG